MLSYPPMDNHHPRRLTHLFKKHSHKLPDWILAVNWPKRISRARPQMKDQGAKNRSDFLQKLRLESKSPDSPPNAIFTLLKLICIKTFRENVVNYLRYLEKKKKRILTLHQQPRHNFSSGFLPPCPERHSQAMI